MAEGGGDTSPSLPGWAPDERQRDLERFDRFRGERRGVAPVGQRVMHARRMTGSDTVALPFTPADLGASAADNRPARVFIVEDDPVMLRMVADYLEQHNMHAVPASGRQEMIRYFTANEPDLVILDLRLGQEDGFDLLREIRSRSDVPIIITTGDRRDEIDRVVGLELGADDYVTKPFSLRELLARIRAVLRRQEAGRAALQRGDPERGRYKFGGWQLDRRTRRLTDPNATEVALTKGEYALLTAFLDAPQRPLSREHLLQATRVHEDIFDRSIDVQILRAGNRSERTEHHSNRARRRLCVCPAGRARLMPYATTVTLFLNPDTML